MAVSVELLAEMEHRDWEAEVEGSVLQLVEYLRRVLHVSALQKSFQLDKILKSQKIQVVVD